MQLVYGLPKEIVTVIMTVYKNTKAIVRLLNGDTEFFDIVTGVIQGGTLAAYMFILCPFYVLQASVDLIKENGFTLKKQEVDDMPQRL